MKYTIFRQFERARAGLKQKPTVGFGLRRYDASIIASLRRTGRIARIVIIGPSSLPTIRGFRVIRGKNPEHRLASMLASGEVDGIVRGTLDDFTTWEAYRTLTRTVVGTTGEILLLEDAYGRQFILTQVSNAFGWTRDEKRLDAENVVRFMQEELRLAPKVGFVTGIRSGTYQRKKRIRSGTQRMLNRTHEDAERLVAFFRKRGVRAKNYSIELNSALDDGCNVIVPPNGIAGNQIFRTLVFLGGGKLLMSPRINLPHPYEDNSRNETDFETHVRGLVSWIAVKRRHQ